MPDFTAHPETTQSAPPTAREMVVNRDTFEEFVSHVQTLVASFDAVRRDGNRLEWHYARDRLVEILSASPFNGERFQVKRSRWGTYRIWDVNTQRFWRRGMMGMGDVFSTRERLWAVEKAACLNREHRELNVTSDDTSRASGRSRDQAGMAGEGE